MFRKKNKRTNEQNTNICSKTANICSKKNKKCEHLFEKRTYVCSWVTVCVRNARACMRVRERMFFLESYA